MDLQDLQEYFDEKIKVFKEQSRMEEEQDFFQGLEEQLQEVKQKMKETYQEYEKNMSDIGAKPLFSGSGMLSKMGQRNAKMFKDVYNTQPDFCQMLINAYIDRCKPEGVAIEYVDFSDLKIV